MTTPNLGSVNDFASVLTDAGMWYRAALLLLGAAMLFVGLYELSTGNMPTIPKVTNG